MSDPDEKSIVTAYSEGRLGRADMLKQLGLTDSIAESFRLLSQYHLLPPQYPGRSSPEALAILRRVLQRSGHGP